jgi:NADH dehydrogenase
MTHLVVGATGLLGGEIARLLAADGRPVRAMVRASSDLARVERLRELGAEIVAGDLRDAASLAAACAGVSVVISGATAIVSPNEGDTLEAVDRDGQISLVEAAERARVARFIYVSFAELELDFPLQRAKRAVEARLRASGLTYTVVRPANFMESWLGPAGGWDVAGGRAQICGSGENAVSWISLADVARVVVGALEDPAAANAVMDVGGPEALSPLEVVRIMEAQTGRSFAVDHLPEEALRAQLEAAPDARAETFAALMLATARGCAAPPPERIGDLTTVREYARTCSQVAAMGGADVDRALP